MDQRSLLMHQIMLADRPRLAAYDRALARAVEPGDIVADVGAGTLVLSLLALKHGAGHVYAVEADPGTVAVAERIVRDNDLGARLTLVQGDARVARLKRKADVVVSEMMGNLGPEEQMTAVLDTFCRRNAAPGARRVPAAVTTRLAAVEFDGEGWGIWGEDFHGFRLDAVQEYAEPAAQLHFFQREPKLLGPAVAAGPGRPVCLPLAEKGRLQAVIGYFTADFGDGHTLANFPSYPGCNWAVWVWPVRHTEVGAGDEVRVRLLAPGGAADRLADGWRLETRLVRQGRP